MTKNGFDCATKLTAASAKALKSLGFSYVARYLGNSWKTFDKNEAKAIQDAGLKLISIFEKNSTFSGYFTKPQGIADAKEAMQLANAVGQPSGTAIYFTVDYDAQPSHMGAICTYLDGLRETLKDYKVGLYGSYNVMMAVNGKVDYYWQTYAWSRGKVADHIHKHQYQNDVKVAGIALDRNDIKKDPGAWGEPTASNKPSPKPASSKIEKYILNKTVNGYLTAADAKAKKNKKGTVNAGTYYVFNKSVGMINLTTKAGTQGTWINPGENVKAKPKGEYKTHEVVPGDTVSKLAAKYGSTIQQIKDWNKLDKNYTIYAGKTIRVR